MARKPSFKVIDITAKKTGVTSPKKNAKISSKWKVEIPERLSPTGERQRAFFSTRDKAKNYAAEMRSKYEEFGTNSSNIKPSVADDATSALALLEPYGISLLEAARTIVAAKQAEAASSAMEAALAAFVKTKSGRSYAHAKAYGYMQRDLEKSFAGRSLTSITTGELLEHTETYAASPASFNALSRLIGAFWRWCARQPRAWCDAKLADVLERKETTKDEIGVLHFADCQKLLAAAQKHYPECVPGFVISLFTGMRKAELTRLQSEDITEDGINLPAASTKTGRRRFIQMPTPLKAWLKAYPVGDTVLPSNWSKKEKAVRRLAGWKVWSDLVETPAPPADFPEWPHNALRHTHASVLVAMGTPLETLTFEFGHSGGAQVLKAHYVGVMPKTEATKILNLLPKSE